MIKVISETSYDITKNSNSRYKKLLTDVIDKSNIPDEDKSAMYNLIYYYSRNGQSLPINSKNNDGNLWNKEVIDYIANSIIDNDKNRLLSIVKNSIKPYYNIVKHCPSYVVDSLYKIIKRSTLDNYQ